MPCIYTAAQLLAKDPKTGKAVSWNPSPQRWIDGSVDNDIPMVRLAEMFNVNHFIVSQVNPHVVPFLIRDEDAIDQQVKQSTPTTTPASTWLNSLSHLAKSEAMYRMHTLADLGIFPYVLTKTVSVLNQKYSGDITIFPEVSYADFPRILSNPTPESMHQAMHSGERATWPKLSIIKNHCSIELALDDAVQKLRARVAFSPSEVELRMSSRPQQKRDTRKVSTNKQTRLKRPISQIITSSATVPNKQTLHTHSQNPSGRLAPGLRHKKSLSIDTVLFNRRSSASSTETSKPGYLNPTKHLQDITSSGADDSNITSSSSSTSLSFSSPTESPSSPAKPDAKWHRSLFESSSQPSTPSQHPAFSDCYPQVGNKLVNPSLFMTPGKNSSEATYKRLFHHRSQTSPGIDDGQSESGTGAGDLVSPRSMKRDWTLEIDIPRATKNLVPRVKKKSGGDE